MYKFFLLMLGEITKRVRRHLLAGYSYFFPVHPSAHKHIFLLVIVAIISLLMSWTWVLSWVLLGLLSLTIFMRSPDRCIPSDCTGIILSPADGKFANVEIRALHNEFSSSSNERFTCVSIFMSIFDAHVNRAPAKGKITDMYYKEGCFRNVKNDNSSFTNETMFYRMKTDVTGDDIVFSQIAGLYARRIETSLEPGEHVNAGDVFGIIYFSSRVEVYLPLNYEVVIREGQLSVAGETIIAVRRANV